MLDTECSKTIVWRDLVGKVQWLEGESSIIQCALGECHAYPLAEAQLYVYTGKVNVDKGNLCMPGLKWKSHKNESYLEHDCNMHQNN